jgi:hypothetical protein
MDFEIFVSIIAWQYYLNCIIFDISSCQNRQLLRGYDF